MLDRLEAKMHKMVHDTRDLDIPVGIFIFESGKFGVCFRYSMTRKVFVSLEQAVQFILNWPMD